jgi:hypothetical protein
MADLPESVTAMMNSPRCGAQTRTGGACRSPAVAGRARCRMHGGAKGSGAREGNRNALKTGEFTRETLDELRSIRALVRRVKDFLRETE